MAITSIVNRGMVNEGIADATALATARTVGVVEEAMTINVGSGGDFATIQEALDWVEARVILADVLIQVADGTYTTSSGYDVSHPNYANVRIRGNYSTPANCVINTGSANVFTVHKGTLKAIYGFKFTGGGHGFNVSNGGIVYECGKMEMTGLSGNGVQVANGASMPYCYDLNLHNLTQSGLYSYSGSYIKCQNLTSQNNTQYGAAVSMGSRIHLWGTTTWSGNGSGNTNVTVNQIQDPYGDLITTV